MTTPRLATTICHAGFTLVETLVAVALSAIMIVGITQLYVDTRSTEKLGLAMARVQDTARMAMDLMVSDIRMAGFQGCASPDDVPLNVLANHVAMSDYQDTALRGFEVTGSSWAFASDFEGTAMATAAAEGSDVLAIRRGAPTRATMTTNMTSSISTMAVSDPESQFAAGDLVLISDCENADVFRISAITGNTWAHANTANLNARLSTAYNTTARLLAFRSHAYYVADTGRRDVAGQPIRALYRLRDTFVNAPTPVHVAEELVEGVEALHIQYGEQLAGGLLRFVDASLVSDMRQVVAVKIGLLVSAPGPVLANADNNTYTLPGAVISRTATSAVLRIPDDRRLRRSFISTVQIRNRGGV